MSIWDTVAAPIIAIINKVVPDKAAAAAAVAALNQMQLQGQLNDELAQIQAITVNQSDINKVEAASPSLFVAGWRPFIGWTCGAALCIDFLFGPMATWIAGLCGHPLTFPQLDMNTLMPLVTGMLGMGTLRTFEKIKGVQNNH